MTKRVVSFTQFVERVLGIALTRGQRTLALIAFDGLEPKDLPRELRAIGRELFGPVDVIPVAARAVLVAVCGARSGKSYVLGALRLVHLALTVRLNLAAGEVASGVIVAPDQRLARQCLRFATGALEATPSLRSTVVAQTLDSVTIERPQDGRHVTLECLPATRGGSAVRGRTLVGAVLDEAAFFRDEDSVVNDAELFKAAAPRIVPEGQLVVASTPWAELGLLFELWRDNFGKPKTCMVAHAPTVLLRDDEATRRMVEREQARDERNASREFGARFGSTEENLLDPRDVEACVDQGRVGTPPERGKAYAMAMDLGVRQDSTAWGRASRQMVSRKDAPPTDVVVIEEIHEYKPKSKLFGAGRVDLDLVELDVAAAAKASNARLDHDIYLADSFAPRLKRRGVRTREVGMSSADQARRATLLATFVRERRLRLPDHPELVKQLKNLRVTRHAGGRVTIAAPKGKRHHDDLADVVLLLLDSARTLEATGGDIEIQEARVFRNGHRFDVVPRQFFRTVGDVRISVAAPLGTPEHDEQQRQRLSRGVALQSDYDELGEDRVAELMGFGRPGSLSLNRPVR